MGTEDVGRSPAPGGVLAAVFLLSAASVADEIFLIRLLSVRFWPHFVPMIVSQAMLGFGAAGVALHRFRSRAAQGPGGAFAWLALLSAPSFELAFRVSQAVPFDPFLLLWDPGAWPRFALFFLILSVPFFLAGGAVSIPLAFPLGKPGWVYAAGFAGSAAGAAIALPAFSLLPTALLLRVPLGLGLAGAAFLLGDGAGRFRPLRAAALAASALIFALPPVDLRLSPYKDLASARKLPGAVEIASRSGPAGDFRALFAPGIHSAPGLSLRFEGEMPPQAAIFADGESRGIVPREGGKAPPEYLDHLPGALPYHLLDRPSVLQFGLRGTEGVLLAARHGARSVTVVDPSPEVAALVARDLAGFSGGWPRGPHIELRPEGGRNFLARPGATFDLIEIPDISSLSFASVGIHATGEAFLLTREGVRAALGRLSDQGVLSYSGWLKAPPRESVKILRTVREELERAGLSPAAERILVARGWGSFVLVAGRRPFSAADLDRARRFCDGRDFAVLWPLRGEGSGEEGPEGEVLRDVLAGGGAARPGAGDLFDLRPVTDDSPYFHRFLRLRSLPEFRRALGGQWVPFVEWGVVFLLLSLAVSLLLAALFLLFPFLARGAAPRGRGLPFALYFTALGVGYMLVELTFLKAGILLLGDPIRAAAAALGGFTFFSGWGSVLSERWASERPMERVIAPGIALLAPAGILALSAASPALLAAGPAWRLTAFLGAAAPAAFLMGVPFPAALARLSRLDPPSIPLALGVNGFFSVAGATLASVGALWAGFRATVLGAAVLYLLAGLLYARLGTAPAPPGGAIPPADSRPPATLPS